MANKWENIRKNTVKAKVHMTCPGCGKKSMLNAVASVRVQDEQGNYITRTSYGCLTCREIVYIEDE